MTKFVVFGIFSILFVTTLIGSSFIQFGNSEKPSPFDFVFESKDQLIYVCMYLEELGGLYADSDQISEDNKKFCQELLENTDFSKKKEIIQKYGELS